MKTAMVIMAALIIGMWELLPAAYPMEGGTPRAKIEEEEPRNNSETMYVYGRGNPDSLWKIWLKWLQDEHRQDTYGSSTSHGSGGGGSTDDGDGGAGVTIPENTDREEEPGYDGGYVDCSASNIHSQIGSALNGFQALVWEDYIAISNYLATVRAYGDPDPDWGGCGEALGELCDDASVFQMGYQYPFFPSLRMHMDMPYDPVTCEDVNALIGDIVAWYGSCGWILDGLPEVYWSTSFEPDDRKSPAVGESYPQWREEECETSGESPAGSGYAPDTLDTRVIGGGEEPSSER